MEEQSDRKINKLILSEGIIIAVGSVLAYVCSFIYEQSYLKVFSIPSDVISVTPTRIFAMAGPIFLVILLLFNIVNAILLFAPKDGIKNVYFRASLKTIIVLVILFIYFVIYGFKRNMAIGGGIALLFLLSFDFVFPLFIQKGKGSYKEKLLAQEGVDRNSSWSLYDFLFEKAGRGLVGVLLLVGTVLYVSSWLGEGNALKQEKFLFIEGGNKAILRIYGENMIVVYINKEDKKIEGSFSLLKSTDLSDIRLKYEKIGVLNFPDIKK